MSFTAIYISQNHTPTFWAILYVLNTYTARPLYSYLHSLQYSLLN